MYNNAVTFKVVSKPRDLFYIETESLLIFLKPVLKINR